MNGNTGARFRGVHQSGKSEHIIHYMAESMQTADHLIQSGSSPNSWNKVGLSKLGWGQGSVQSANPV